MTDNSIEVACALRDASQHLHLALDQFYDPSLATTYPAIVQIELQIQAAIKQLQAVERVIIEPQAGAMPTALGEI